MYLEHWTRFTRFHVEQKFWEHLLFIHWFNCGIQLSGLQSTQNRFIIYWFDWGIQLSGLHNTQYTQLVYFYWFDCGFQLSGLHNTQYTQLVYYLLIWLRHSVQWPTQYTVHTTGLLFIDLIVAFSSVAYTIHSTHNWFIIYWFDCGIQLSGLQSTQYT